MLDPLSSAYEVLFRQPPPQELRALDGTALKRTFRRRAMECHPDRAGVTGRCAQAMQREFTAVSAAYETLTRWLETGELPARPAPDAAAPQAPRGGSPMPFGEFLVQSGRINRATLQAAVAWQLRDRPRWGELAVRWGVLSEARLELLLRQRYPTEPIAAAAVRLGYVTLSRAEAILGLQVQEQKPLGIYLVALGAFPHHDLQRQLDDHARYRVAA